MLPFQIGRHQGAERKDHCRRVALLVERTSAFLPLTAGTRTALTTAAALHHFWTPFHAETIPETAAAILNLLYCQRRTSGDDLGLVEKGLAARILETCDAFDEAMEFAALEGISLREAADSFHRETSSIFDPQTVSALRRVTSATEFRPSPAQL